MNDEISGGGQQLKRRANQDMQTGSGLTRYRSAPSSYFTNLLSSPAAAAGDSDGFGADDFAQLFNPRASSPETQRIFSRFMNSIPADNCYAPPQFLPPPKHEADHVPQPSGAGEYSSSSTAPYHHPGQNSEENLQNEVWSSYTTSQIKMEGAAGHSGINIEAGTAVRFNNPMDISSKPKHYTSSAGMMPPTVENNPSDQQFDDHRGRDSNFVADYINPWDDFLEGPSDKESKRFANSEGTSDQGNEGWNRPATLLCHHLSLPAKMSAELSMEKLLQDSVPCKVRAKRGCATHPRSIAERVRRTKISDRIRKLQELVPNMEKQTNTSDMLDLAVDYIKDLQDQVKTLSDNREKCCCPAKNMQ